jgi:tetratricopeptide (TPR) repeat protein
MPGEVSHIAKTFIERLRDVHKTAVQIREVLPTGKSGAFVAVVDCSGAHDGVYVLKVDALPTSWDDEETRHKRALKEGAFSSSLPAIVLSDRTESHYCLLVKIAGHSRIASRPLVAALGLFRSAYSSFATIAWTPPLFAFGDQQSAAQAIADVIGYKLIESEGGRIAKHLRKFIGSEFLTRPLFLHNGQLLPNPFSFLNAHVHVPILRPLKGPVHGDCHGQNLFVKAAQDAAVSDVFLIDLATYQSHSLLFFDHAYLELATMLRQMNQLGERRWLEFVAALAREGGGQTPEPHERGWLEDILASRKHAFELASASYPDRMDDLRMQFLLAHVAAGLAFLHKVPREGEGSGGLTPSQYRQSFIWSAVFLQRLLHVAGHAAEDLFPGEPEVPVFGPATPTEGPIPSDADWARVKYFDADGFNVLVLPNSTDPVPIGVLNLPWTLIIDFREEAPTATELHALTRPFRLTWPGEPIPDPKLLSRGGIWYFANGRIDLSGVEPAGTPAEWRRRYRRTLDDLLLQISDTVSPTDVRGLILGDGFILDHLRMIIESLDTAFHSELAPIVIASRGRLPQALDDIPTIPSSLDAAVVVLGGARSTALPSQDVAFLPRRHGSEITLTAPPPELLARISRDLTVVFRGRANVFPEGRTFGVGFRRGMPIEWAELAQNLDVPRSSFSYYSSQIEEEVNASSNRTVNLLHEPSAGGTTLGRRLAWTFMERVPTVCLEQISSDTASYLRELFQFCALPVLVLMESTVITESEREGLLQQLREDNTRAVFLWVSRAYSYRANKEILPGQLDDSEAHQFLDAYLDQVADGTRREALHRLASARDLREQRNPFFFGLTAFGENFLGVDRLLQDVMSGIPGQHGRQLLTDLALVSLYAGDGFPSHEFAELCDRLNDGQWPVHPDSLFLLRTATHVRVSHSLLAQRALVSLARNPNQWRADLSLFSQALLNHLSSLEHKNAERVQNVVQTLFITRDIESTLQADVDAEMGGIARQRRFAPLINDLGNVIQARAIFRRVVQQWPREPHYAAHLARHLMYEEPKEIDEAVQLATRAEKAPEAKDDAALVHVAGMAYRVRMEQRLREAKNDGNTLRSIEDELQSDFQQAVDHFARATNLKPSNEHGLVATIQTTSTLLRLSVEITKANDLGSFLRQSGHAWYLEALALAEESIDSLEDRPHLSIRARNTIAQWNLVYGQLDKVVADLRALAARHEDLSIRRALCAAIVAKAKHNWNSISQGDLQTIALMMERNITQQGVRDSDIRRWLAAYRRLRAFDVSIAIERLIDWHRLSPKSIDPVFYLYVLYFLRWLTAPVPREGLALELKEWLKVCQANRPLGYRSWSYEWLEKKGDAYRIAHFSHDLDFDPPSIVRVADHPDRKKLDRLARIEGTMRDYHGPQNASLDLGQGITMRITPLDRLTKDDTGKRVSAYASFSYDGIVGWDPRLVAQRVAKA